jgi:hypothetical protein
MTATETRNYSLTNILGSALLVSGALIAYLRISGAVQHITSGFPAYSDTFGTLPAVGLAAAHLLQSVALEHSAALSTISHFLLSCWPVAIMLLGVILLRKSLFATPSSRLSANPTPDVSLASQQGIGK